MNSSNNNKNNKYSYLFLRKFLIYAFFIILVGAIIVTLANSTINNIRRNDTAIKKSNAKRVKKVQKPRPLADKVNSPNDGIFFGVYQEDAPFKINDLNKFEKRANKKVSIIMWYQPWAEGTRNSFDQEVVDQILKRKITPMISWEPWDPGLDPKKLQDPANQPDYQLRNIISGDFDGYLHRWAKDIKAFGGPIMLRPMHEMNGFWYPWGGTVNNNEPKDFIEAWRHIFNIFQEEGATNVTWVWSVNNQSAPITQENTIDKYYPGDEYVDWTSISGFNWGESSDWSSWRTFDYGYTEIIKKLTTYKKPIIISEIGCVESGGDKANWIIDTFSKIKNSHPQIKGIIWYNRSDTDKQDWRFDSSPQSKKAFVKSIQDPYFKSDPSKSILDFLDKLSEQNIDLN